MKNCHKCHGNLLDADDIVNDLDGYFLVVKGKRCTQCGEEIIGEEELSRLVILAKKIGVWGEPLKLHRKLSKSAGGTVLRIPNDIEEGLHLKGNEQVAISKVGNNKILVEIESE